MDNNKRKNSVVIKFHSNWEVIPRFLRLKNIRIPLLLLGCSLCSFILDILRVCFPRGMLLGYHVAPTLLAAFGPISCFLVFICLFLYNWVTLSVTFAHIGGESIPKIRKLINLFKSCLLFGIFSIFFLVTIWIVPLGFPQHSHLGARQITTFCLCLFSALSALVVGFPFLYIGLQIKKVLMEGLDYLPEEQKKERNRVIGNFTFATRQFGFSTVNYAITFGLVGFYPTMRYYIMEFFPFFQRRNKWCVSLNSVFLL